MKIKRLVDIRRGLLLLLGMVLVSAAQPKPGQATLLTESAWRAFVSGVLTWDDHAIVAWYGGPQELKVVRLQRLDATLGIWSRPIPLTDASHQAYEPRLASSGKDVLIAWYEKQPQTGASAALLARLDWSGHPLWYHVLSHPGRDGRNPVVRAVADGAWVAWLEADEDGGTGVWVERLSADGEPLAAPQRAGRADHTTSNLNAAVDATGQLYVVFDAQLDSRARELQLVTAGSQGLQQHPLTRDDGADSVFPDIAIEGEHVGLCWVDARNGRRTIALTVGSLADIAAPRDARASLLTHGPGEVGGSYLAWNQGRLGVAWNRSGANAGLYLQRFDASGRAAAAAVRLAQPAAGTRTSVPAIAPWKRGFALAWNDYTTDDTQHQVVSSTAFVTHGD